MFQLNYTCCNKNNLLFKINLFAEAVPPKMTLHFVSWNINGIKAKLPYLLNKLDQFKADVAFIQETHVGPTYYKILETVGGWQVYFTVYSSRSKGVAILMRKDTQFKYICHDEDHSGGYIVLFCHLYGELYTLVNVYNHKKDRNMLNRLKNYLMETNKGMLLVGGDFNTVLDPSSDRRTSAADVHFSALRPMIEDFTASLSLIDVWSYIRQTDEGYTRKQNESESRIDMFLMYEDAMERVKCRIGNTEYSDHAPLILELKVQKVSGSKVEIPEFASMLEDLKCNLKIVKRPGMINGAEILSVIKSLPDFEKQRPDGLNVDYYKMFRCPMTEVLKANFNLMIQNNYIPEEFTKSYCSKGRHIFNVDYLIFTKILAKRLNVFIAPNFRRRKNQIHDIMIKLVLNRRQKKISLPFLEKSLENLKQIKPAPPRDFRIIQHVLPAVKSNRNHRKLKNGCPLTKAILDLALKQLENKILRTVSSTSVCFHRQTLTIRASIKQFSQVNCILKTFDKMSGLKMQTIKKFCWQNK